MYRAQAASIRTDTDNDTDNGWAFLWLWKDPISLKSEEIRAVQNQNISRKLPALLSGNGGWWRWHDSRLADCKHHCFLGATVLPRDCCLQTSTRPLAEWDLRHLLVRTSTNIYEHLRTSTNIYEHLRTSTNIYELHLKYRVPDWLFLWHSLNSWASTRVLHRMTWTCEKTFQADWQVSIFRRCQDVENQKISVKIRWIDEADTLLYWESTMSSGELLRELYGIRRSFTTRSPKGDILFATKQRIKGREEVFCGLLNLVGCNDSSKVENFVIGWSIAEYGPHCKLSPDRHFIL